MSHSTYNFREKSCAAAAEQHSNDFARKNRPEGVHEGNLCKGAVGARYGPVYLGLMKISEI